MYVKESQRYNVSVLMKHQDLFFSLDYFVFRFFSILSDLFPLFTSIIRYIDISAILSSFLLFWLPNSSVFISFNSLYMYLEFDLITLLSHSFIYFPYSFPVRVFTIFFLSLTFFLNHSTYSLPLLLSPLDFLLTFFCSILYPFILYDLSLSQSNTLRGEAVVCCPLFIRKFTIELQEMWALNSEL